MFTDQAQIDALSAFTATQLNHLFPDPQAVSAEDLWQLWAVAGPRAEKCFSPYLGPTLDDAITDCALHTDRYAAVLYLLSQCSFRDFADRRLATKLYCLNKALHALDAYFTSDLPAMFRFVHPLGTILGRAEFADHFTVYQGCTVGVVSDRTFPVFRGPATLYANAKVLGRSRIGSNVLISQGVTVVNTTVPDNVIVSGVYPDYSFKELTESVLDKPPYRYRGDPDAP